MNYIVLLKTCFRAIVRNPMRATLTILGIIIGIAAVIAIMEIGNGSAAEVKKTMAAMGADTLTIMPGTSFMGGINTGSGGKVSLTYDDCHAIATECSTVKRVSPVLRTSGQVIYGEKNWAPESMNGGTVDYLKIRDWYQMESGAPFSEEDVSDSRRVCVIGKTVQKQLFGGIDPVGQDIRIKNVNFKIVGVLKGKGSNMMGRDQDDVIIMPWTSVKSRLQSGGGGSSGGGSSVAAATSSDTSSSSSNIERTDLFTNKSISYYTANSDTPYSDAPHPRRFNSIDSIMVQLHNPDKSSEAVAQVSAVLRAKHRLEPDEADDFNVRDMADMSRMRSSTNDQIISLLKIVAGISLVVGGVGIMNIMLVSVTERTREIGLRMAVGARPVDIMRQFLLEAVILCLIGGVVGIGVGHGASELVSHYQGWGIEASPETMVLAVSVAALIGMIFGWYPAWKASRMDPIDALRHE